jgi:hypothetical protein
MTIAGTAHLVSVVKLKKKNRKERRRRGRKEQFLCSAY